ncbi:MAG: sensor histidine kinase [Candidatus Limnocylindria bacterium]
MIRSPLALDLAPTVVLAVIAFVETWPPFLLPPQNWDSVWVDVAGHVGLIAGLTLPLALRRRYPVLVLLVVLVAVVVGGHNIAAGLIALVTALFSMGLYTKDRSRSLAGLGAVFGTFVIVWGMTSAEDVVWTMGLLAMVAAIWLTGDALRGRTERAELLERRAVELESRRAGELQRATAAERTRIARELHDVIAHNLSVVVIQAGAALRVQDEQPDAAREALRQVEASGRQAMTEMRRLLGVLRRDGDEPDETLTAPQPGIAALPALLDEVRVAGLAVTLSQEGEPGEVPAGADVSVYRIVQEALTNVLRHANATRAEVQIRHLESAIEVEVTDDGRAAASTERVTGHGLAGMRERAELFDGTFEAGPRPEGGFLVRVRLPTGAGRA